MRECQLLCFFVVICRCGTNIVSACHTYKTARIACQHESCSFGTKAFIYGGRDRMDLRSTHSSKVRRLVLTFQDLDDLWKSIDALDERVFDRFAEIGTKFEELLRCQVLIAEEDHFVVKPGLSNILCGRFIEVLQVDAVDLCA